MVLTLSGAGFLLSCVSDGEDSGSAIRQPASGVTDNGATVELNLDDPALSVLGNPGGMVFIQTRRLLVVNNGGSYFAFSSICPHASCDVSKRDGSTLVCPCHNSRFSLSGGVTGGPAGSDLDSYAVSQSGNVLTVTL